MGYINLAGFSSGAGRDFRNAMLTLRQAAPGDLKGLILDLRGMRTPLLYCTYNHDIADYCLFRPVKSCVDVTRPVNFFPPT